MAWVSRKRQLHTDGNIQLHTKIKALNLSKDLHLIVSGLKWVALEKNRKFINKKH